jgi:hypothetical protein
MIKWCVSLFFILLLTGCATLTVKENEENVYTVITLINKGDSEQLINMSRIPFIYDGEIILLQKDIQLLWDTLSETGFSLHDPEVVSIDKVDDESYAAFTSSAEGKFFFKRHLPEKAVIATVSTQEGTFYFITGNKAREDITIFGMKGPVK